MFGDVFDNRTVDQRRSGEQQRSPDASLPSIASDEVCTSNLFRAPAVNGEPDSLVASPSSPRPSERVDVVPPDLLAWEERECTPTSWVYKPTRKGQEPINWSPWTRVIPEEEAELTLTWRELWCWALDDVGWWLGFHFLVGSLAFGLGAMASCVNHVANTVVLDRWLALWPYELGCLEFAIGAGLLLKCAVRGPVVLRNRDLLQAALPADPAQEPVPIAGSFHHPKSKNFMGLHSWNIRPALGECLDAPQPVRPPMPRSTSGDFTFNACVAAQHLKVGLKPSWTMRRYWLDLSGALLLCMGVGCYTWMVSALIAQSYSPQLMSSWATAYIQNMETVPTQIGGTCFLVTGYLFWVSTNESWAPWAVWRPATMAWWIAVLNFVGSVGFFLAGFLTAPWIRSGDLARLFIPTAIQVFIGWGIGCLLFALQSWFMIIEIAIQRAAQRRAAAAPLLEEGRLQEPLLAQRDAH